MKIKALTFGVSLIIASACSSGGSDSNDDKNSDTTNNETTETGSDTGSVITGALALNTLPDISTLVADSSSAAALNLAVEGTPIKISEFKNNASKVDEVMFDGAVAAVTAAQSATQEQKNAMERGDALCRLTSHNADVFNSLQGGTLCYMSKISDLEAGSFELAKESDTVTSDDYSGLFSQEDDDKLVRVNIVQDGQVGMAAHIKVVGTGNSPDAYKIEFYMCEQGNVTNSENYEINPESGLYSRSEAGIQVDEQYGTSKYTSSVTAYLKDGSSGLVFDFAKDRIIERLYQQVDDNSSPAITITDKQNITINSDDEVTTKAYGTFVGGSNNADDSEKLYSVAVISGSGFDITMPEVGMSMIRAYDHGSDNQGTYSPMGAVEWQNTKYVTTEESDLYKTVSEFSFDDDDYFSEAASAPSVDLSGFSCEAEVDIEINWQMNSASFEKVNGQCDGGSDSSLDIGNVCNDSSIQNAFNYTYN